MDIEGNCLKKLSATDAQEKFALDLMIQREFVEVFRGFRFFSLKFSQE